MTAYDQHSRLTIQSHKLAIEEHKGITLGELLQRIQSKGVCPYFVSGHTVSIYSLYNTTIGYMRLLILS